MIYHIVPKHNTDIPIEADSPEDAIVNFAQDMDSDMHNYFTAIEQPTPTTTKITEADVPELIGQIIDGIEDQLNKHNNNISITGDKYDAIAQWIHSTLYNWGLTTTKE